MCLVVAHATYRERSKHPEPPGAIRVRMKLSCGSWTSTAVACCDERGAGGGILAGSQPCRVRPALRPARSGGASMSSADNDPGALVEAAGDVAQVTSSISINLATETMAGNPLSSEPVPGCRRRARKRPPSIGGHRRSLAASWPVEVPPLQKGKPRGDLSFRITEGRLTRIDRARFRFQARSRIALGLRRRMGTRSVSGN